MLIDPMILLSISGLTGVLAFAAMRYDPQRLHGKILRRMAMGTALLVGWNLVSGMQLGVNPLSMLTAGMLGLPGIGLLSVMAVLP